MLNRNRTGRGPRHPVRIDPAVLAVAETLRVNDASAISGLSRSTLYHLMNTGALASVKIRGRRLIRRPGLVTLLQGDDVA